MSCYFKKLTLQYFCLGILIFIFSYIVIGIISGTITYSITNDTNQSIYGAFVFPCVIIPIILMSFSCCFVFCVIFSDIKNNCCYDKLDSFYVKEVEVKDIEDSVLTKNPLEIEYGF